MLEAGRIATCDLAQLGETGAVHGPCWGESIFLALHRSRGRPSSWSIAEGRQVPGPRDLSLRRKRSGACCSNRCRSASSISDVCPCMTSILNPVAVDETLGEEEHLSRKPRTGRTRRGRGSRGCGTRREPLEGPRRLVSIGRRLGGGNSTVSGRGYILLLGSAWRDSFTAT